MSEQTINHHVRVNLGLSCDEYCIMDAIHKFRENHGKKVLNTAYIENTTGFDVVTARNIAVSLEEKGLIVRQQSGMFPSEEWKQHFNTDEQFEKLWDICKRGNKNKAKEVYKRALKIASYEAIRKGWQLHVKNASEPQFVKHLSSFLNPKYKYWEDEAVKVKDDSIYSVKLGQDE